MAKKLEGLHGKKRKNCIKNRKQEVARPRSEKFAIFFEFKLAASVRELYAHGCLFMSKAKLDEGKASLEEFKQLTSVQESTEENSSLLFPAEDKGLA